MDWLKLGTAVKDGLSRYKFVLLILCVGILLMTVPGKTHEPDTDQASGQNQPPQDTVSELTEILGQIYGVGKVRVMLTEAVGAQTVYQTDEDRSQNGESSSVRVETVLISSGGTEQGLIRTVTPPVYLGAVVVCQGGGDPAVRLAVTQAVSVVTGIGTDRITVLKMK